MNPDAQFRSQILQNILALGPSFNISKTLVSQTRLPSQHFQPWEFINFLPQHSQEPETDTIPENEQFTQTKPKLKSQVLKQLSPSNLTSYTRETPKIIPFDTNTYLNQIKQQTISENLSKLPKDTIYHQLVSITQQKPFFNCKNAKCEIQFNSKFDSGNLFQAFKTATTSHFDLYTTPDYTTIHGGFWWFFAVQNPKNCQFRLTNFSQIRIPNGYRPLIFTGQKGWHRSDFCGVFISSKMLKSADYYQQIINENRNQIVEKVVKGAKNENINRMGSAFVFDFTSDEEIVYFASSYVYGYSELVNWLGGLRDIRGVRIKKLTNSECYNQIPVVEISRGTAKKALIFTARIHAQDTSGNYLIEGFVDFLLGRKDRIFEEKLARIEGKDERLRYEIYINELKSYQSAILSQFNVVIFPMINVDGVILGNSTRNFTGEDLNKEQGNSTIQAVLQYIEKLSQNYEISHFFDLHEQLSKPNFELQFFESTSISDRKMKFWQAAGSAGFLPFIESASSLSGYFDEESVSQIEQSQISTEKLKSDNESVRVALEVFRDRMSAGGQNLDEFVLPMLISQFSGEIMDGKRGIGPEDYSVAPADSKSGLFGVVKKRFGCKFCYKVFLSQFFGNRDMKNGIQDYQYYDIADYNNFGINIACGIGKQLKNDYEQFNEIRDMIQEDYVNWLVESLKIAITRQNTLSLIKITDIGPSAQKMMKFKLWALAKDSDIQLKQLTKINDAIDLNLILDLNQNLQLLTDSEEDWDAESILDPQAVQEERIRMSEIIKQWYPIPEKKKSKKGKKKAKK